MAGGYVKRNGVSALQAGEPLLLGYLKEKKRHANEKLIINKYLALSITNSRLNEAILRPSTSRLNCKLRGFPSHGLS